MSHPAAPGLRLDATSALPVFEQIQTQVVDLVTTGRWPGGTRLPPVRTLADELGVAPGTVAKAYRALEQEGFVVTAGRRGTVVAEQQGVSDQLRAELRAALQPFLDRGLKKEEVVRLVQVVLDE